MTLVGADEVLQPLGHLSSRPMLTGHPNDSGPGM